MTASFLYHVVASSLSLFNFLLDSLSIKHCPQVQYTIPLNPITGKPGNRQTGNRTAVQLGIGDHEDFEESDDSNDSQRRGANKRRSDSICQTIGLLRDSDAS